VTLDERSIGQAVQRGEYELSWHADEERLNDHLTIEDIEAVLQSCEILERYPQDPRGESCLVLGFCGGRPVHIVCGSTRQGKLFLITVYIPGEPKWKDPRTRRLNKGTP
jgi:hypothetical protein